MAKPAAAAAAAAAAATAAATPAAAATATATATAKPEANPATKLEASLPATPGSANSAAAAAPYSLQPFPRVTLLWPTGSRGPAVVAALSADLTLSHTTTRLETDKRGERCEAQSQRTDDDDFAAVATVWAGRLQLARGRGAAALVPRHGPAVLRVVGRLLEVECRETRGGDGGDGGADPADVAAVLNAYNRPAPSPAALDDGVGAAGAGGVGVLLEAASPAAARALVTAVRLRVADGAREFADEAAAFVRKFPAPPPAAAAARTGSDFVPPPELWSAALAAPAALAAAMALRTADVAKTRVYEDGELAVRLGKIARLLGAGTVRAVDEPVLAEAARAARAVDSLVCVERALLSVKVDVLTVLRHVDAAEALVAAQVGGGGDDESLAMPVFRPRMRKRRDTDGQLDEEDMKRRRIVGEQRLSDTIESELRAMGIPAPPATLSEAASLVTRYPGAAATASQHRKTIQSAGSSVLPPPSSARGDGVPTDPTPADATAAAAAAAAGGSNLHIVAAAAAAAVPAKPLVSGITFASVRALTDSEVPEPLESAATSYTLPSVENGGSRPNLADDAAVQDGAGGMSAPGAAGAVGSGAQAIAPRPSPMTLVPLSTQEDGELPVASTNRGLESIAPSSIPRLPSARGKRPRRVAGPAKRWAPDVETFRKSLPTVKVFVEDRRQVPFRDMRGWIDSLADTQNKELVAIWDRLLDALLPTDTMENGDEEICRFVLQHHVTDQVDPTNDLIRQTRQAVNNAIKRELECPAELGNLARGYTFRDLFRLKCRQRPKEMLPLAPPVDKAASVPASASSTGSSAALAAAKAAVAEASKPAFAGPTPPNVFAYTGAKAASALERTVADMRSQDEVAVGTGHVAAPRRTAGLSGRPSQVTPQDDRNELNRLARICDRSCGQGVGEVEWWLAIEKHKTTWSPSILLRKLQEDGRFNEVFRLLFEFRWIRTHVLNDAGGVRSLVFRGFDALLDRLRASKVGCGFLGFDYNDLESLRLVKNALLMMLPQYLNDRPGAPQLATQLYGKLVGFSRRFGRIQLLLQSIRTHVSSDVYWFRPMTNRGFDEPMTDIVQTMRAEDATVVAIARNGKWVAAAGGPRHYFSGSRKKEYPISVWVLDEDTSGGKPYRLTQTHEPFQLTQVHATEVTNLAISPCSLYMVSSSVGRGQGSLKVWQGLPRWLHDPTDVTKAPECYNLDMAKASVTSVVISDDSKFVAATFQQSCLIKLWTLGAGMPALARVIRGTSDDIIPRNLALSSKAEYFALVSGRKFRLGQPLSLNTASTSLNATSIDVWCLGGRQGGETLVMTLRPSEAEMEAWTWLNSAPSAHVKPTPTPGVPTNGASHSVDSSPVLSSVELLECDQNWLVVATGGSFARMVPGSGFITIWRLTRNGKVGSWERQCLGVLRDYTKLMGCVTSLQFVAAAGDSGRALFSGSDDGLIRKWTLVESVASSAGVDYVNLEGVQPQLIGAGNRAYTFRGRGSQDSRSGADVTMSVSVDRDCKRCVSVYSDRSLVYVWDIAKYMGPGGTLDTWKEGCVYRSFRPACVDHGEVVPLSLDQGRPLHTFFDSNVGMRFDVRNGATAQTTSALAECVEVDIREDAARGAPPTTVSLHFDHPLLRYDFDGRGIRQAGVFARAQRWHVDPREEACAPPAGAAPRSRGVAVRFADDTVAFLELMGGPAAAAITDAGVDADADADAP